MIKPIVCLAVLVASLACATARSDWINLGPAPQDAVVKFTFAVRQNPAGVKKIDGLFWELSNPRSVNFGQWLTRAQVKEIVKPSDTDKAAVIDFCRRNRIVFEDFGEFVEAHATVGDLGDVFRGRFEAFQNARNGETEFNTNGLHCLLDYSDSFHPFFFLPRLLQGLFWFAILMHVFQVTFLVMLTSSATSSSFRHHAMKTTVLHDAKYHFLFLKHCTDIDFISVSSSEVFALTG